MPRSSKAPPLPPEPDFNEIIQNDVARLKRLLGLDVNRLAIGQEIEGIVTINMFGARDFTITGLNTIEFVNVSTSMAPQQTGYVQTDFIAPVQVTGLIATAAGSTQINLNWTANTEPDLVSYNVYRGTSPGFAVTLGTTTPAGTTPTNSYGDPGRIASTTYYYKVSAVDTSNNIGALSTEANATTTATPPPSTANLWLKFDGNYADSSTFANSVSSFNTSGFAGSGVFGTNSVVLNSTSTIDYVAVPNSTNTALDLVNGFSYSCWIYLTDGSSASQYILSKRIDTNNSVGLFYSPTAATIGVDVYEAGTLKSIKTSVNPALNTWHHIVLTYDGTNPKLYLNKTLYTTASSANFGALVTTDLIIGNLSGGPSGNQTFQGRIDEFMYFKGVVLTQTQVNNLFATNSP